MRQPTKTVKKEYYPFMDGLRAVAILWVLNHHLETFFNLRPLWGSWFHYYQRFARIGFIGVDIFFVISGFLITGLLIKDFKGEIPVGRFYLRRFFKIMPQYLIIVILAILINVCVGQFVFLHKYRYSIISFFFLYQNYVRPFGLLPHLWSIAIEEHFYFVYPLLLQMIFLFHSPTKRKITLILILLFAIILGNYLRMVHLQHFELLRYPFDWHKTHVRFDALLFGCLIKIFEPYLVNGKLFNNIVFSTLFFAVGVWIFESFFFHFGEALWYEYTLAYVASGLIVIAGLQGFIPIKTAMELKVLRFIGKNSYAIYLWHYVVIVFISRYMGKKSLLWAMVALGLTFVLGVLSTRTIERYFLNLRERIIA